MRIWHVSYRSISEQEPRGEISVAFLHLLILFDPLLSALKVKSHWGSSSLSSTMLTLKQAWGWGLGAGGNSSVTKLFRTFRQKEKPKICHFGSALLNSVVHFTLRAIVAINTMVVQYMQIVSL